MLDTYKHKGQRARLVEELEEKGINDSRILDAIAKVPRHLFVENAFQHEAYEDKALPIQSGQTISQPFTVAYQTYSLDLKPKMKILEVGTGSGYQAAILAAMGMRVFSVEIDARLHREAKERLDNLDLKVKLHKGDGSMGWPTFQPYEHIIVTAASPGIPESLKQQLEIGGMMILPVGNLSQQQMTLVKKISRREFEIHKLDHFHFVPLRGKYGFEE